MPHINAKTREAYNRNYYLTHKTQASKRRDKLRDRNKAYVLEVKSKSGCEECGETHIACLDFHHDGSDEKEDNIANGIFFWGLDTLKKEIAKCRVLCSNCHRKHHWKERQE